MPNFHTFINKEGGISLYSDKVGDIYYSYIGAYNEAMQKFVYPILTDDFNRDIRILDVCYGLGFNSKSFLTFLFNNKKIKNKIEIDGIEIDKDILALSLLHYDKNIPFFIHNRFSRNLSKNINLKNEINKILNTSELKNFITARRSFFKSSIKKYPCRFIKNIRNTKSVHNIYYQNQSIRYKNYKNLSNFFKINYKIKDLLLVLPDLDVNKYDYVFFDAFSPTRQPELWTVNVFDFLYKSMKNNSKLLTYSKSKLVRLNMSKAGFIINDIYDDNNKIVGTIAIKT